MRKALALAAAALMLLAGTAVAVWPERRSAQAQNSARADLALRDADIAFHERRAAEDPWSAADRAQLAGLWLQRGRETGDVTDYRRAESAARASLSLREGRNGKARLVLASSLLALHRFAEALDAAESLVRDEPEIIGYRALLAEILLELGRYDSAAAHFDTLYHARRDPAVAPRLARWFEIRGEAGRARRLLEDALEQAKARRDLPAEQVAWFHLRLADHALRFGRLPDAEAALRAGLRIHPGDGRLLSALGRAAAMRGDRRSALAYIARAGDRADLATLALAGDMHAELGDSASAEAYFAQAEAAYASNPEPFARQWSQYRIDHKRHLPETLMLLRREVVLRPDVLGWDMVAWALYQSGEFREASNAITQALRMGTQDALLFYHAGFIERALGNTDSAEVLLRRALDINPRFHPLYADSARIALRS
jgi:tetratricopeptide (TPR) repeat protein